VNDNRDEKTILSYCEPWSLRAGESIRLLAASEKALIADLDLVRIECGDPGKKGPGYIEHPVASALPDSVRLEPQKLSPGSWAEAPLGGIGVERGLELSLAVMPTRTDLDQVVACVGSVNGTALALTIQAGFFTLSRNNESMPIHPRALSNHRWYTVNLRWDLRSGTVAASVTPGPTRSPGREFREPARTAERQVNIGTAGPLQLTNLYLAREPAGHFFDGRIARPRARFDDIDLNWDMAAEMGGDRLIECSSHARHGRMFQLPTRAVTGPAWDGSAQSWRDCPAHYDAVHFHSDDLYDAGWSVSAEIDLARDLPSGIYAFRLRAGAHEDRVPFFVRPALAAPTAEVALLMPSCTYMAYANHRVLVDGAEFVAARNSLTPEHEYVRTHRELGPSCYEKHSDGSGVMFSSRRRPVLQMRPGSDRWNFTPDTCVNAFLEHLDVGHDIIADEDLHHEGVAALSPYRVVVTGTHPEYWSTAMLDALEQWQRQGGRLMYLGGNGFYWRVAFSDAWPGAIELRRAEDGVRPWQPNPGEYYHAFNGEYGGLWRRLGRAPNELVGIGFAAQGFERAVAYQRNADSFDPRASWIFDGVADGPIGSSGIGGGAAGQEIDRYDEALGSPSHALVVASATDFGADMVRTKEEFEAAMVPSVEDDLVRADVVFYETPAGGAVFSVGSISWFGALARNDYTNDVAQITANVVRRFLDPRPFEGAPGDDQPD
jgi:N,N-dimethylformamidase